MSLTQEITELIKEFGKVFDNRTYASEMNCEVSTKDRHEKAPIKDKDKRLLIEGEHVDSSQRLYTYSSFLTFIHTQRIFANQFQASSITLQSVQDDFTKIKASKTKDWRFQVKVQKESSSIHFIQDLKSHSTNTSSKVTMHISRERVHIHKRSFQDWRNQDKVNTFRTINKQLWFIPWKPSYLENLQTTLYTHTKPHSLFKRTLRIILWFIFKKSKTQTNQVLQRQWESFENLFVIHQIVCTTGLINSRQNNTCFIPYNISLRGRMLEIQK